MGKPMDNKTIGEHLHAARRRAGRTLADAQAVIRCTRPTMIATEKGRREILPHEIVALSKYYGVSIHEIVSGEATRLKASDPLGMLLEVVQRTREYDGGDMSESLYAKFLSTDRVGARGVAQSVRAMATVVASLLPTTEPENGGGA